MINKKATIEMSIGTIVIIVLSMTMLILGMVLIKNIFEKPDFKITQEEGWEKYRYSTSESDCDFGMVKKDCPQEKLESLSKSKNFPNNINWTCCYEEICEVEVEEIEMNCSKSNYNKVDYPKQCEEYDTCLLDYEWYNLFYTPEFKDDKPKCENDCKIPVISKQDLTTEWLFTNCICEIFSYELPKCFTNKEAMESCEKYQYNDYEIEVIR